MSEPGVIHNQEVVVLLNSTQPRAWRDYSLNQNYNKILERDWLLAARFEHKYYTGFPKLNIQTFAPVFLERKL